MNENVYEYFNAKYRQIRVLHKTEKTEVYLIEGIEDKRLYVKKVIHGASEVYPLLKDIRCEFIPRVVYVAKAEQELWVVEEYVEGETLRQILDREKNLPRKRAAEIITQLCGALDVLHSHNIIHRDIKPSNIIVDEQFNIKLIDFDAARCVKNGSLKDTAYLGTEGYAPPEQYGFSQTDYRSDIYSAGVLMKEMLGWDNYRGCYKSVIDRCMKIDPLQRYQSVSELKRAVRFAPVRKAVIMLIIVAAVLVAAASAACIRKSGISVEVRLNNNERVTTELTTYVTETSTETTTEIITQTTTAETTQAATTQTTTQQQTETTTQAQQTAAQNTSAADNTNSRLVQRGENYINNGIYLKKLTSIEMEPNREHTIRLTVEEDGYYDVTNYTIDQNNKLWVCVLTGNMFMADGWVCVDDPISVRVPLVD